MKYNPQDPRAADCQRVAKPVVYTSPIQHFYHHWDVNGRYVGNGNHRDRSPTSP